MEEKGEEVHEDSILGEEDIWLEAPESKIQSIPEFPWATKLFMACKKVAWSHVGTGAGSWGGVDDVDGVVSKVGIWYVE